MPNVLNLQLKKELVDFIDQAKLHEAFSLANIATSVGLSQTTLSMLVNDKYTGRIDKCETKIRNFLQREKEKRQIVRHNIPFVTTTTAKRVFEVARLCHLEGEIGVISGDAGNGKTLAIKEYAKKYSDVIVIEADLGYSAKILFRDLLKAVDMEVNGYLHDMFEVFVTKVKDSGKLIIIDEAEHLPYRALELVRRINDKGHVGILLVGMNQLINNLRGRKQQYRQLYSRVGISYKVGKLSPEDTKEIIHSVFPSSNGLYKTFHEKSDGNARTLSKLIARVDRVAKINHQKEITEKVITKAAELLMI